MRQQHIRQEMLAGYWKDQTVELEVGGEKRTFKFKHASLPLRKLRSFSLQGLLGP